MLDIIAALGGVVAGAAAVCSYLAIRLSRSQRRFAAQQRAEHARIIAMVRSDLDSGPCRECGNADPAHDCPAWYAAR